MSVHAMRAIIELFTSTFLTSYILSITPDNVLGSGIINIGIFYISWFTVYTILYYTISHFVDKSNRVSFLRIGILVTTCLMIALVFWGDIISHWIVLAGSLCGISDAFYYSSYLIMRNELNSRRSMKKYNITYYAIQNSIKIIVPTILGYLIDIATYSHIAIYFVVISLIQFSITFMIVSKRPENSNFSMKGYFKYLKRNKEVRSKIKYTYLNSFLGGFKTTYKIVVTILTIYTFKTNFSLGILSSVFSIVAMLILMTYKKFDNSPKVNKFIIYLILGIVPFVSCILLVVTLNITTLIIYNICLTIAIAFSDYLGTVERDTIIKNLGGFDYIAEHQCLYEIITSSTRIIAFGLFIVIGVIGHIVAFKILLLFLLILNPIKFMIMYKQRLIRKEYEGKEKQQSPEQIVESLAISSETTPQV